MSLIDRYIFEVGKRLPKKVRADVGQELRSLLGESLEARAKQEGREADEGMEAAILQEFGSPEDVAASYYPGKPYLIGPRLFPVFLVVVQIVLWVVGLSAALGLALDLATPPTGAAEIAKSVFLALGSLWTTAVAALGTVTLVFAVIERVSPVSEAKKKPWDPRALPMPDEGLEIKRAAHIAGLVVVPLLLVLLNFFPQYVGFITSATKEGIFVPLLGPWFQTYLPMINVILLLALVLNGTLLAQGRWSMGTRVMDVGLALLQAILFLRLLTGPSPFDLSLAHLTQAGMAAGPSGVFQDMLLPLLDVAVRVAFAVALALNVAGVVLKTLALIKASSIQRLTSEIPTE